MDDPPGFRIASDGSGRDQQYGTAFVSFGPNPRAGTAPTAGTSFEDAIRSITDPVAYLSHDAAGLAPLSRAPIQEAIAQIARIYADASTKLSGVLGPQTPDASLAVPASVGPHPSYPEYLLPSATEPAAPQDSRPLEDDIRLAASDPYANTYLTYDPADLATLQRNPIHETLKQITRIYAVPASTRPVYIPGPAGTLTTRVTFALPRAIPKHIAPTIRPASPYPYKIRCKRNSISLTGSPQTLAWSDPLAAD